MRQNDARGQKESCTLLRFSMYFLFDLINLTLQIFLIVRERESFDYVTCCKY